MDVTALDPLKRCIHAKHQEEVYTVVQVYFTNWPHDSLQTGLETGSSSAAGDIRTVRPGIGLTMSSSSVQVDEKWQGFVAENILFYTNILRLLLPRFQNRSNELQERLHVLPHI